MLAIHCSLSEYADIDAIGVLFTKLVPTRELWGQQFPLNLGYTFN